MSRRYRQLSSIAIAAFAAFSLACSSGAPEKADDSPDDDAPAEAEKSAPDESDETKGESFRGRLEIDLTEGGKEFQGTWLITEDTRYILDYRPMEEYFAYVERQVIVDGEEFDPDPRTQHIMADHLRVHSMEIAEGEEPIKPTPNRVPAPPLVDNADNLDDRDGMWSLVTGTLDALGPPEMGTVSAYLHLDGGKVVLHRIGEKEAEEFEGNEVTILGILYFEDDQAALSDITAVCPDQATRCGM